MPSLGHKGQQYKFAFKQTELGVMSPQQKADAKKGMLVTVTSEWFRLRTVGTSPHIGVDLSAPSPQSVYSLGDGKVVGKGYGNGTGNYLVVQYSNGDNVRFMHLSSYGKGLDVGDDVYEGQIIAMTGNTGKNSKGKSHPYHLHVDAVNADGTMVNPLDGNYGTVSSEEFFTKYNGDYKKLQESKQKSGNGGESIPEFLLNLLNTLYERIREFIDFHEKAR
jgi:murein DD-endopeptidase MepM/ murein hydrolase activator NlpD